RCDCDLPVRHPMERPAVPVAVHPVDGGADPAPGAAQLPGPVPDQLPDAVHRRGHRFSADRGRLRAPAALLRRRYDRGCHEGLSRIAVSTQQPAAALRAHQLSPHRFSLLPPEVLTVSPQSTGPLPARRVPAARADAPRGGPALAGPPRAPPAAASTPQPAAALRAHQLSPPRCSLRPPGVLTVSTQSTGPWLARRVTGARADATGVDLELAACPGVHLDGAPGWLTGEDPRALGVELTMPNLPQDLQLPDDTPQTHRLRVDALAPDLVRVRSGSPDHAVFSDDGTALGIVTDPTAGGARAEVRVEQDETRVVLRAGTTEVRIDRYPAAVTVTQDGRTILTSSQRLRQVAGLPTAPPFLREGGRHTISFELSTDEDITGFGEQFGRLVKNGQRFDLRVEDALGTGTGLTYKPVPVWHSSAGYLGFLNTGAHVTCDVGHT